MRLEGTYGLTNEDLEELRRSFITPEIAADADLQRVDDVDGAAIVGRTRKAGVNYGGIKIPYFDTHGRVQEYQIRRDTPEYEMDGDGKPKEKGKYLFPPGRGNLLYLVPGTTISDLKDEKLPLVITEGAKKALALLRLSRSAPTKFLPVGLSGVWNWRGRIGKTTTPNGERADLKGPIQDLDLIKWNGRTVYILFDTNIYLNESVRRARQSLANELRRRKAIVFFAELPKDCGVNGIDDYLGQIEQEKDLETAVEAGTKVLENAKPHKPPKSTQSEQLIAIADDIELFHTKDSECFGSFEIDHHMETHRLNSKAFKNYLVRRFYEEEGKSPSSQALQGALGVLIGKASYDRKEMSVHVRYAWAGNNIYLDLCNELWQVVEISKDGYSVIEAHDAPVRFRRTKGMRPLPAPAGRGNVYSLSNFLNLRRIECKENRYDVSSVLILSFLVACMRPDRPFPILILTGPPGTAKTTATRVLRELIDPSMTPHRSCPRNEQDLMIAASNAWLCSFDNVSHVKDWLSDALCRLSTGGGFSTRTLFENDEETMFDAKRPIILNGIGSFASRSDLVDRAIIIELKPIPKSERKSERQFWTEFEVSRKTIFTGLIEAVSSALANIESVRLTESPRMADFAEWAVAAEEGLGLEEGDFLKAYQTNRDESHSIVLEGSILAEVLQEYCAGKNGEFSETILLKWFLAALNRQADADEKNLRSRHPDFPKSSKGLRGELARLDSNLREIGIFIEFLGRTGPNKRAGASLKLDFAPPQLSRTSQSSQVNENEGEICDGRCNVAQETDNTIVSVDLHDGQTVQTSHEDHLNATDPNPNGYIDLGTNRDVVDVRDGNLQDLAREQADSVNGRLEIRGHAGNRPYVSCAGCGKDKFAEAKCPYCQST